MTSRCLSARLPGGVSSGEIPLGDRSVAQYLAIRRRLVNNVQNQTIALERFGVEENFLQTQARPMNGTRSRGEPDCLTFHAPTKPVERLFFLAFDNQWITSDAERGHDRPVRLQFAREPVGPVRNSRDPVNVGETGPNESVFRACQQSPSRSCRYVARSDLFRQRDKMS